MFKQHCPKEGETMHGTMKEENKGVLIPYVTLAKTLSIPETDFIEQISGTRGKCLIFTGKKIMRDGKIISDGSLSLEERDKEEVEKLLGFSFENWFSDFYLKNEDGMFTKLTTEDTDDETLDKIYIFFEDVRKNAHKPRIFIES